MKMNDAKEAETNSDKALSPSCCPTKQHGGAVVIVLLRKKVGGESGLKKVVEL